MTKMPRAVASAVFVSTGLFGAPAFADSVPATGGEDQPRVTVVGEASVSATPDVMKLDAGVEVVRPTAGEAFTAARTAAAALTRALLAAGIAARDLRTNELSLGPQYKEYPTISGYRAAQGVEAVVRDIDDADDVVDAAAAAGEAVRLDSVSFEVSDNRTPLRQARDAAFAEARSRADQYATLAGRRLGRALEISEENATPPRPFMATAGFADKASISPGSQNVSVSVKVVYELD